MRTNISDQSEISFFTILYNFYFIESGRGGGEYSTHLNHGFSYKKGEVFSSVIDIPSAIRRTVSRTPTVSPSRMRLMFYMCLPGPAPWP